MSAGAGISYVRSLIKSHAHFPIQGVLFHDGNGKGLEISNLAVIKCVCRILYAHAFFRSQFRPVFNPWTTVFPIFRDPKALEITITTLVNHIFHTYDKVDAIVGIDSRGFLFGPILAMRLGCAFVPVRKPGKVRSHG